MEKPRSVSVLLHWISAGAILIALFAGIKAVYGSPMCCSGERGFYFLLHAYAGLFVLGLVVVRLFFRVLFSWPGTQEKSRTRLAALAASATHWTLYGLAFFIPLNGWIVSSASQCCVGVPELPNINLLASGMTNVVPANADAAYKLHTFFPWVILVLIVIHTVAALFHHFVLRDDTLTKMLPGPARRKNMIQANRVTVGRTADQQSRGGHNV